MPFPLRFGVYVDLAGEIMLEGSPDPGWPLMASTATNQRLCIHHGRDPKRAGCSTRTWALQLHGKCIALAHWHYTLLSPPPACLHRSWRLAGASVRQIRQCTRAYCTILCFLSVRTPYRNLSTTKKKNCTQEMHPLTLSPISRPRLIFKMGLVNRIIGAMFSTSLLDEWTN